MGTHPIFESDFDCLTDNAVRNMVTVLVLNVTSFKNRLMQNKPGDDDIIVYKRRFGALPGLIENAIRGYAEIPSTTYKRAVGLSDFSESQMFHMYQNLLL